MKLLTKEQQKSYQNAKKIYICNKKFEDNNAKDKSYCKVRNHSHYTGEYRDTAHSKCNVNRVFLNGSNYDYHFIIKGLAE